MCKHKSFKASTVAQHGTVITQGGNMYLIENDSLRRIGKEVYDTYISLGGRPAKAVGRYLITQFKKAGPLTSVTKLQIKTDF